MLKPNVDIKSQAQLTMSPDLVIWIATGLAKGYITVPEELPLLPPLAVNGVYQNNIDGWWYIQEDKEILGPYSQRGAKMLYTKLLKKRSGV